jgi:hypothetical protein
MKRDPKLLVNSIRWVFDPVFAIVSGPFRFARWSDQWLRWWARDKTRAWLLFVLLSISLVSIVATRSSLLEIRFLNSGVDSAIPAPGADREVWAQETREKARLAAPKDARTRGTETVYLPPKQVLRFLALGHQSFVSDMLFIRANGYFSSHLWLDRRFPWLDHYVAAIIGLDPDNPRVYVWASQVVKYGQLIDDDVIERSNRYSRLGAERFPDNWQFYHDIGANYLFEGRKTGEDDRKRRMELALPYIKIATSLPNSQLDPNFLANIMEGKNDHAAALSAMLFNYWRAPAEQQGAMRGRLVRLGHKAKAKGLDQLKKRWLRLFPYIQEVGLFRVIGADAERDEGLPSDWSKS